MAGEKPVGLIALAVLALAALPEPAICDVAARAAPPVVLCGAEGKLPDPTDCSYYVDCTKNSDGSYTATINPCPQNTYYNSCLGNCSKTKRPENCSVTCDESSDQITVSDDNRAVFFICISNNTHSYLNVSMCTNGLTIDDLTNSCNGENANCPINNTVTPGPSTCNQTGYYADETNCSVYYYCSDIGVPIYTNTCSSGQYYNASSHSCGEFQCKTQGLFADPASCTGFYQCTTLATGYSKTHYDCPTGSHFDSSAGGCMMGYCTTVCPGTSRNFTCPSTGVFPDPNRCESFYYCNSTLQPSHVDCPPGSHFDSSAGGCMMGACSNRLFRTSHSLRHQEAQIPFWSFREDTLLTSP